MSGSLKFPYRTEYNSIHGNNLPTVLKAFNLKANIKNEHQEAAELLNVAKELEKNIEGVQRATTSLKGFSVDFAG